MSMKAAQLEGGGGNKMEFTSEIVNHKSTGPTVISGLLMHIVCLGTVQR